MLTDAEKRRLTPEDLLIEERALLKRKSEREEDIENYNQYCAVEEALERNPDIDLDRAIIRGKRVNGRNTTRRNDANIRESFGYKALVLSGAMGKTFQEIYEDCQSLASFFRGAGKAAAAAPGALSAKQLVQTDLHEFDFLLVSAKTKEQLDSEASVINTRVLALAGIKEPGARRLETENIRKEAERLKMVQHPETNLFVHSEARVITLEMINNPAGNAKLCTYTVCVFRPRPQGADSMGIRSKVADVLDQNPEEVRVSGDHIKPEFKHS